VTGTAAAKVPTFDNTLEAAALGGTDNVDEIAGGENISLDDGAGFGSIHSTELTQDGREFACFINCHGFGQMTFFGAGEVLICSTTVLLSISGAKVLTFE
jgi:hypothetical protein